VIRNKELERILREICDVRFDLTGKFDSELSNRLDDLRKLKDDIMREQFLKWKLCTGLIL